MRDGWRFPSIDSLCTNFCFLQHDGFVAILSMNQPIEGAESFLFFLCFLFSSFQVNCAPDILNWMTFYLKLEASTSATLVTMYLDLVSNDNKWKSLLFDSYRVQCCRNSYVKVQKQLNSTKFEISKFILQQQRCRHTNRCIVSSLFIVTSRKSFEKWIMHASACMPYIVRMVKVFVVND